MKDKEQEQTTQNEQELTGTGKELFLKTVYDAIPAEQAQALKIAAAAISGKAADALTIGQAMQILERGDPNPTIRAAVDSIAEKAAHTLLDGMSDAQAEQIADKIQALGQPGNAISLLTQVTNAIQETANKFNGTAPNMNDAVVETVRNILEALNARINIDSITKPTLDAIQGIAEFLNSDTYRAIKESVAAVSAFIAQHREEIETLSGLSEEEQDLVPFIAIELQERKAKKKSDGLDLSLFGETSLNTVLQQGFDEDGNQTDSPFTDLIERAKQRKAEFEATEETLETIEQAAETITKITYTRTADVKTVTDKLANVFYSLAAPNSRTQIDGQRQMIQLKYEGSKSKKEVTLFYDFVYNESVFDKYGLSRRFDDFDFFVMSICDSLYNAGNEVVTLTRIYREMGNDNSPNSDLIEQILNSLIKGMSTIITIDNKEVMQAWRVSNNSKYREIISPVMPVQLLNERSISRGRLSEGYVRITSQSPFFRVANPIGHVTAWDKEILRLYKGKRTKRYYSVLRFLIQQIGWMRNGNRNQKILYSSLYHHTGDKTTRAQQLTRDMMYRILDNVFKPANYITAYKEDDSAKPGVILTINRHRQKIGGRR